jgi:hypothetical protein
MFLTRIRSAFDSRLDPVTDPRGLKRAKMKREKNAAIKQIKGHTKYKKQCRVIGIKMA